MRRVPTTLSVLAAGILLCSAGQLPAQCSSCVGQPRPHYVGCCQHQTQPRHAEWHGAPVVEESSDCCSHSECHSHHECHGNVGCRHHPVCDVNAKPCCPEPEDIFDNFSVVVGFDSSKQPQDFGVNSLFGGRAAVNWGLPLSQDSGLGLQIGTSLNYSDNSQPTLDSLNEASGRTQNFTTVGLFQRRESGLNWAIAWDHLYEVYYDHFLLNQFRSRIGWELNDANEVGFRSALSTDSYVGFGAGQRVRLQPLNQGSLYWQHLWENQARTTLWLGVAERHGMRNLALEHPTLGNQAPNTSDSGNRFLIGGDLHVPLNDRIALYGQGNFISPVSTGSVDAFLGIAIYPGGGARRASTNRFTPLLPVANNATMAIDLR